MTVEINSISSFCRIIGREYSLMYLVVIFWIFFPLAYFSLKANGMGKAQMNFLAPTFPKIILRWSLKESFLKLSPWGHIVTRW